MKHLIRVAVVLPVCAIALSGCASATWLPSFLQKDPPLQQATVVPDPPQIVHTVQVVQPLPLPGQLQPKPHRATHVARPPKSRVEAANLAALQEPTTDGYINAIQVYPYSEGALYRLYAAPQEVSDIALQPGESLTAISAGDTTRWVVGDTTSGSGASKQVHILVKAFRGRSPHQSRHHHGSAELSPPARKHRPNLHGGDLLDLSARRLGLGASWQRRRCACLADRRHRIARQSAFRLRHQRRQPAVEADCALSTTARMSISNFRHRSAKARRRRCSWPGRAAAATRELSRPRQLLHRRPTLQAAELRLGQDHQQVVRIKRTTELRTAAAGGNQQAR